MLNLRQRLKPQFSVIALVLSLLMLFALPVWATATSGRIYKGEDPNSAPNDICGEAIIRDTADNVGTTFASINGSCWMARNVNAGVIGVKADGYQNGGYCGTTNYAYNGSITSGISVGSVLCPNPAGNQNFNTISHHRVWNGSSYNYLGSVTSPNQTY